MLLPLLLAAALQAPSTSASLPPPTARAIEALVGARMTQLGVPGLAAAVVSHEQVVWAAPFGMADLENGVSVRTTTSFRLASLSKPITAVAVLQLVERGKIDLDAPIQRYVPSMPEKPWPVTVRQLLGHLGGVRHYKDGEFASTRRYASVTEGLGIFRDDPLAHPPGTKFLYTSYGYNLLGAAVEGASGEGYLDYVRRNVFEPAGMFGARDDDLRALIPHRAQGYVKTPAGDLRNSELADTSNKIPGGGLVASAEDVARFAMALTGGLLLDRASVARMLTRQSTRDGKPVGYGMGFFLTDRGGMREAWHTGGQQRVSNVLYLQPDRHVGVVLLCNLEGVGPQLTELAREVADLAARPPAPLDARGNERLR
jgi:serine beta-lactamase-like protein LACTB, mitochondrial